MSSLAIENCKASWAMSTPFAAQCSAARPADLADLGRGLVPGGQRGVRQEPGRERRGVHEPDALALQVGHQVGEHRVLERVVVVREDHVEVGAVEDVPEDVHRVAADADEPDLALLLELPERRQGLVDDLRHLDELDVVAEDDVEVVDPHPVEADVDALDDPPGREVEVGGVVAAELGAEEVRVAGDAPEGRAEQALAQPPAVEGRGVDEVHAEVERDPDRPDRLVQVDRAELRPRATTRRSSARAVPGRSGPAVGISCPLVPERGASASPPARSRLTPLRLLDRRIMATPTTQGKRAAGTIRRPAGRPDGRPARASCRSRATRFTPRSSGRGLGLIRVVRQPGRELERPRAGLGPPRGRSACVANEATEPAGRRSVSTPESC